MTKTKIGVLGAGTWGTALARMLAGNGCDVTMWSALPDELKAMSVTHAHPNLPGMCLPADMHYTADIEEICGDRDVLLFAVPSVFVRSTARKAAPHIPDGQLIVDVAKGVEEKTLMTMSEIIEQELAADGKHTHCNVVALSGPTHAEEVARDMPTLIVAGSPDEAAARKVQKIFTTPTFRVYTNTDRRGVELGGAGYDIYAMANSWLTMALNGCGWLLVVVLLTPRMESLRQKVGGGDEVWLGLITCSASIGLFGYMASQYYNKIVVDPAQAWSCIAGTVVMVACVKFSKKMPWLKEYGLGIAIVIGIVVGALVR